MGTPNPRRWRTGALALIAAIAGTLGSASGLEAANARIVGVGYRHTCALTAAGGVKCWGANGAGQLGDGTTAPHSIAADVPGLTSGVVALSVGSDHACAVTAAGGVKCWGGNGYGQLGDGTTADRTAPVDVPGLTSDVAMVAAGHSHTCAVTMAGAAKCWGDNSSGQLGDGSTTSSLVPLGVSGLSTGVASVSTGVAHSCAVTGGGSARCWGDNSSGQLGDGTTTARRTPVDVWGMGSGVSAVSAGAWHTCAVTTVGGLQCWGDNGSAELGDGSLTTRTAPVGVSGLETNVRSVSAGYSVSCAVTTGGGVRCWGLGGLVGDGASDGLATTPVEVPALARGVAAVSARDEHVCAVTTGGGVRCWGTNDSGALGNGAARMERKPVDVLGLRSGVTSIGAGHYHACAATAAGGAKCWGDASVGAALGDGTTTSRSTPVVVWGLSQVQAVSTGAFHSCALVGTGGVKCWGDGSSGAVGDGTQMLRLTPVDVSGLTSGAAMVDAGYYHTCAVTTTGTVKCWGSNASGQVGDGTTIDRTSPVDVPGLSSVTAVSAGRGYTCAVTEAGSVKCWGSGAMTPTDVAELASGVLSVAVGEGNACAVMESGALKCWTTPNAPAVVPGLESGVASVAIGPLHTCVVMLAGGVKCWGSNDYGQLGDGTTDSSPTPVDVAGLSSGVARVVAGGMHTCVLMTSGAVACWGDGGCGQLGNWKVGPHYTPIHALAFGSLEFDGDDVPDAAVYRPSSGSWFSLDSSAARTAYRYRGWGVEAQGDAPVLGDFDGDGIVDPTVYRPATGTWFTLESHEAFSAWSWTGWGEATDVPVPGDYDGDGITDVAVYRPSTGRWYVRPSSGATPWNVVFGETGDQPVAGDFDGDGRRDPAVYRPSTGTWFWLKSSANYAEDESHGWGIDAEGDVPAPGDYDGDGATDPCVFRPATGAWFILESRANHTTWNWFGWGRTGDIVAPADFDGDGKTDGAIYRPSTGTWFVRPSSGASEWTVVFGQSGDVPLK
jgi:alpha-tubulin suppressor-like RCC1 family protein